MPTLRSRRVVIDGEVRPATIRHEDGVITEIGDGSADDDFGDLFSVTTTRRQPRTLRGTR